ncbi:sulfurase [Loktanella sp. 3ANDIMAR09]|uniref:MOSC domain-containing protein n=1 Tax=Loktanella sp. 3ANDIMAR09 TaxID=1225657 RepID=UPI0006FE8AE5|nr:MOSC domain-containing protein [Loktanella sp. 3ANDIMAR09]KQI69219.1 sulfurase [Loktanella sp. 3ANDIMAR09]
MPQLVKTEHTGRIVWMGRVPHRDRAEIAGQPVTTMDLDFSGAAGEVHAGLTRPSCVRVTTQYPKGTEIRNVRQVSIVSAEELGMIADDLGLEQVDPAWLGASLVIEGIADFSHIPPSARLQSQDGTTLTVDMQNAPCTLVAKTIEEARPGHGKGFKAAAKGRRGVTAWVERPGRLALGDVITLHVPNQRAWRP